MLHYKYPNHKTMNKYYLIVGLILALNLSFPTLSLAQGMMGGDSFSQNEDNHTAREEAEGKEIWNKMQNNELECEDLSDDNFGALGEYYMGQMASDSHEAMNNMMTQMMGQKGEKEMHITMGKRMSVCDSNAAMPQSMMNGGIMPMMMGSGMMGGNFSSMLGFGSFGWIFMVFFWVLMIAGGVALIKLIFDSNGDKNTSNQSALDILKKRYAKGELSKKQFESKKNNLK